MRAPTVLLSGLLFFAVAMVSADGFIHTSGRLLVEGQNNVPIRLRGINFNNDVDWLTYENLWISPDHAETDFGRVAAMGMNCIRYQLDHRFFEDESEPGVLQPEGVAWLDSNIVWAKRNDLRLILDMQVPPGGVLSLTRTALWTDPLLRHRLKRIWHGLAARYTDETAIAGYDLLNEPVVPVDHSQWTLLAQELIDTIRTVDQNHLIFIEESFSATDKVMSPVNDDNVVYDFHFYYPHPFTHQYEPYANQGDFGPYPDTAISLSRDYLTQEPAWHYALQTERVPLGDSDWNLYTTELHAVTDSLLVRADPVFYCNENAGTLFIDLFFIEEYDETQQLLRRVVYDPEWVPTGWVLPRIDTLWTFLSNWLPYATPGDNGNHAFVSDAYHGETAVALSGVTDYYSLSNSSIAVTVRPGSFYRLGAWMKGEGVTGQSGGMALDFLGYDNRSKRTPNDKRYLETVLTDKLRFGEDHHVPMHIGEFGAVRYVFMEGVGGMTEDRGGISWVTDMLDLFDQYGLSYHYLMYHAWSFGLYFNHGTLPDSDSANQPLIDLFTERLSTESKPTPCKERTPLRPEVRPNPFCGYVTLFFPGSNDKGTLSVYTIAGKKIIQREWADRRVPSDKLLWDISFLAPGIYLFEFRNGNTTRHIVRAVHLGPS